jgi:hypothetical protein
VANKLVTYDVKVPDRDLVWSVRIIGWILVFAGIALGFLALWNFVDSTMYGYEYLQAEEAYADCIARGYSDTGIEESCEQPVQPWYASFEWYYPLLALPVGTVIVSVAGSWYRKYFATVYQGKVVHKDTGGGGKYSLDWVLCVEGNNLANEKIRQWKSVYHSFYEEKKVGDYVDFRD